MIKNRLLEFGWSAESPIFDDPDYLENSWRLDFAKEEMNHQIYIKIEFLHFLMPPLKGYTIPLVYIIMDNYTLFHS